MQRTSTDSERDVTCRLLTEWRDLEAAAEVTNAIWDDPALVSPSLLRAYTHFGNPTFGAFDADGLCGISIGWLAPAGGVHLHSHITGVLPRAQHLGIGFQLKVAQRDWCLENGVADVTWTFDPMIARNAFFNLHKLGAVATAFHPGFYGEMRDAFNRGDMTDRLEAHWPVKSARVDAALRRQPVDQGPIARRVAVPREYLALRAESPGEARATRVRVRDELRDAFAEGLEIVDFNDDGEYCFAPAREW